MSESYENESIFFAYLKWHYGKGLRELFGVTKNFLWFITHFFSFKLLLKTLLSPWRRLGEPYNGGFDLKAFASTFIINILMRLVGFFLKAIVLLVGLFSYLFVLSFFLSVLLIWLLTPAVLIGSLILSVTFFII